MRARMLTPAATALPLLLTISALLPTARAAASPLAAPARAVNGADRLAAPGPPPGNHIRTLLAAGDVPMCHDLKTLTKPSRKAVATANLLGKLISPHAWVAGLGDENNGRGTYAEFVRCYGPTWGLYKAFTSPVPGNHEYLSSNTAAGYFKYFGQAAGPKGKGYYSYNLGRWHIVALNSECTKLNAKTKAKRGCGKGSAEETWLRADLSAFRKAHPNDCVLAYWHRPIVSSGAPGKTFADRLMIPIWKDLQAVRTAVVLNGHWHQYERFAPQVLGSSKSGWPLKYSPQGLREFVVGTGGAKFFKFLTMRPHSAFHLANNLGILQLTLNSHSYSWKFWTTSLNGKTIRVADHGSSSCP